MVDEAPDSALVARCLAGDTEAFEPLVRRYQQPLYNAALRVLGDREEARDVVQEGFLRAFGKLSSFDPRYRFFSWVYRIVLNEALNVRGRRPRSEPLKVDPVSGRTPEEGVREREARDGVQAALLRLPADDRQLLVLRHFAELSYAEIAETLGIAETTVKSRLHEARLRLGRQLLPGSVR